MKRRKAKEILADSFRELAETKSVNKIMIQELSGTFCSVPVFFSRKMV